MAKLSKQEIEHVARLARIGLSEKEVASLATQTSSILDFVETIQASDTETVEPTNQVTGLSDVWREDRVVKCKLTREQLLANAPEQENGYIKVPKVL